MPVDFPKFVFLCWKMELEFYKYHGTGNDFIILHDNRALPPIGPDIAESLCNRHTGIGSDGIIIISEESGYDFRMRFINPDGTEGSMCGNGGRCAVMFYDRLTGNRDGYRFRAVDGDHTGEVIITKGNEARVRITLKDVSAASVHRHEGGLFLDTGAPHLVLETENLDGLNITESALPFRNAEKFKPAGVNVNFIERSGSGIRIRTFEKGVEEETLSCGTGVTAAAIAAFIDDAGHPASITIETRGGALNVAYDREGLFFRQIWLEGPAVFVYKGTIKL